MTDRPILFSGPMVRALLDGRKTQTRRVLHAQPPAWVNFCEQPLMFNVLHQWVPSGLWRWAELDESQHRALRQWPLDEEGQHYWLRPRFAVGDHLWVREAWRIGAQDDGVRPRDLPRQPVGYQADCRPGFIPATGKFRPSMFMPRWASRLTLVVTEVRVQRLQDISEADAIAEGIERDPETRAYWGADGQGLGGATRLYEHAAHAYRDLWDHLNAARGFGWDANPWIVALTFTVHHQNIDALGAQEAA